MKMKLLFAGNFDYQRTLNDFTVGYNAMVMRVIKRYFDGIDKLNDESLMYAKYSIFYLRDNNWTLTESIIGKCDKKQVRLLMLYKNSDNETVLHRIHYGQFVPDKYAIIDWYLTEIIPADHPMLFVKDNLKSKTILMLLIESGLVFLAKKLLDKVTDKQKKLELIN